VSGRVGWIDVPEAAARDCAAVAWLVRLDDPRVAPWLAHSPLATGDLAAVAGRADAIQRLARRRLARLLLGRMAGIRPEGVELGRTEAGAPVILHPAGWYVSLAGRAGWCAVAAGRAPVGVDVEPLEGAPLPDDLLTPAERGWIAGHPPAERLRASIACWVAKEAHAKRFGRPRSLDPAAVDTQPAARSGAARSGADWSRIVPGGDGAGCIAALAVDIE
jgi:phosphopantetheinyl transferase